MAEPYKQDISFFRGEDFRLRVTMAGADDVSDWEIGFYIRTAAEAALGPLVERTVSNGGVTMTAEGGAIGEFTVTVTDDISITLTPGTYRYDLWRIDEGDEVMLAYGVCKVLGQVRHDP